MENPIRTIQHNKLPRRHVNSLYDKEINTKLREDNDDKPFILSSSPSPTNRLNKKEFEEEKAYVETLTSFLSSSLNVTNTRIDDKENVSNEYKDQLTKYGQPKGKPIPDEYLPPKERKSYHKWWKYEGLNEIYLNEIEKLIALPIIKDESLERDVFILPNNVPPGWTELMIDCLYIQQFTRQLMHKKEQNTRLTQQQYDLYYSGEYKRCCDRLLVVVKDNEKNQLINWKTIFYVVFLMRTIQTEDCYFIEDDLFSHTLGYHEYDLSGWSLKYDHVYRLYIISQLTGDSFSVVYTFDLICRFKRSRSSRALSITMKANPKKNEDFLGLGSKDEKSFLFVKYIGNNNRVTANWIEVGLNKETVQKLKEGRVSSTTSSIKQQEEGYIESVYKDMYYDGPYCEECRNHHTQLSYCKTCYLVQYCSKECEKKNKERHQSLCDYNKDRVTCPQERLV